MIYFNDEDILKVIHEGFSDEDNEIMLENISNVIENTDLPKGKVSELIKNQE